MAPKKSIAKKQSHAGKKAPRKAGSALLYSLFLQKTDGAEAHFWVFDGLDAVVATIWSWRERQQDLISNNWSVQHPRYGWQNAYDAMVTTEDEIHDRTVRSIFAKHFKKCMRSKWESFEAETGTRDAKIACYRDANRVPFWRAAGAGSR